MPSPSTTPDRDSLWLLTAAPSVWAAHLLLSYVTAAIWCAKFAGPAGALNGIPQAVGWYTAVALGAIAVVGWEGWRRHRYPSPLQQAEGSADRPGAAALRADPTETTTHDLDTREDRHRFLGFATLLLSGLSAVGVLYAALAATFFDTCR